MKIILKIFTKIGTFGKSVEQLTENGFCLVMLKHN